MTARVYSLSAAAEARAAANQPPNPTAWLNDLQIAVSAERPPQAPEAFQNAAKLLVLHMESPDVLSHFAAQLAARRRHIAFGLDRAGAWRRLIAYLNESGLFTSPLILERRPNARSTWTRVAPRDVTWRYTIAETEFRLVVPPMTDETRRFLSWGWVTTDLWSDWVVWADRERAGAATYYQARLSTGGRKDSYHSAPLLMVDHRRLLIVRVAPPMAEPARGVASATLDMVHMLRGIRANSGVQSRVMLVTVDPNAVNAPQRAALERKDVFVGTADQVRAALFMHLTQRDP